MLEAFSETLTCRRFAGAPSVVAFYSPDGLAVYQNSHMSRSSQR
jgi:hypothetical protein